MIDVDTRTPKQKIITDAKANGGYYDGDKLPDQHWAWPTQTWMQKRLAEIAQKEQP